MLYGVGKIEQFVNGTMKIKLNTEQGHAGFILRCGLIFLLMDFIQMNCNGE